eukprot:TRINITY_DN6531_c0_g2_i1.p1 TRINITY_DN6531_c0_g2~~TRINITY_DN6531_c0_g2_i1.p1  ORF type:complete len:262 (-),score=37.60 TRINITY_DN6531_c0_g2_i1:48-833(-)
MRIFHLSPLFLVAAVGHEMPAGVELDSVCPSDTCESEESLSLRQLRATGKGAEAPLEATAPVRSTIGDAGVSTDSDADLDGLPGGWGEAESEVQEEHVHLENMSHMDWYHHHHHHHHHAYHPGRRRRRQPPASHGDAGHHHQGGVITVYHQTGSHAGPLILAHGFRPGHAGWCGGGIYFAMSPKATQTKAIGPDSHKGFMIQAQVDVGRVKHMPRQCDRHMSGGKLHKMGYDSIRFNPGDGDEVIVYDPSRVKSMKRISWR